MRRIKKYDFSIAAEILEEKCLLSLQTVLSGLIADPLPPDDTQESPPAQNSTTTSLTLNSPPVVPVYHSNPGAAVSVYLDFDGNFESQWGAYSNVTTPVFSTDSDLTTFNSTELAIIQEAWQRAAEDYAPFNVDVTTELPMNTGHGQMTRVAIGGSYSDWYGSAAGGVAYLNSFTSSVSPNTVYAFAQSLYNNARYIGDVASHESGHSFGLLHQSLYDANGNLVTAYNTGSNGWAPIMGYVYNGTAISTWYNGTTTSSGSYQDDMAVIANSTNGFGYKVDDYGNTIQQARVLPNNGATAQINGLISTNSDADVFVFSTNGGNFAFQVTVATVGPDLDSVLELRDNNNILVASSNSTSTLNSSLFATLGGGTYYLTVKSNGTYGRVGTYVLAGQGSFIPVQNTAPVVNAGADRTTNVGLTVNLNGQVYDDGLPNNQVASTWRQTSGPGIVTFGNPSSVNSTVSFNVAGTYVLRLTANDGELESFDEVAFVVGLANAAPQVNAGLNQTITGKTTFLQGVVTDDGLPNGTLTYQWTKVSGKGKVTFSSSNSLGTNVTFGKGTSGTYVFRLTASDGQFVVSDDVVVTLSSSASPLPFGLEFFFDQKKHKDIDVLFTNFEELLG